jgi:hypothetical protein
MLILETASMASRFAAVMAAGKIHQFGIRQSKVIIDPGQRRIRALRLEQPPLPGSAISGAAQQLSILLPRGHVVGLSLQTLPEGVNSPFSFPPVLQGACNLQEPESMRDRARSS